MRRRVLLAALAALAAIAAPASASEAPRTAATARSAAPWPETISGVAEARIVGDDGRFTTRLAFAAAVDPPRLRIEVVKGGTLQALAWYDESRVMVVSPGEPALVHEGPPTRATLEETLGLPFCPAEVFAALRGGLAPPATCGGSAPRAVGEGGEAGLEVGAGEGEGRATLRFSHFRREGGRPFPRRIVLDSDLARATLEIVSLQESPKAPAPPSGEWLQRARRVGARELADALGLRPAPAPAGGGGTEEQRAPDGRLGR